MGIKGSSMGLEKPQLNKANLVARKHNTKERSRARIIPLRYMIKNFYKIFLE